VFNQFIVQPIFNILETIYALLPGHDLGIAIILFTILVRLALWPIVKKQLHQAALIKKLQPQLKAIKKEANGDKQKETRLQMELYKEYGVKPMTTILTLVIQLPIFIGLYQAVLKFINKPQELVDFAYEPVKNLGYIQEIARDTSKFGHEFLGFIDLARPAIGSKGPYLAAFLLALLAGYAQYRQSKLMVQDSKDAKTLKGIMQQAAVGTQVDQSDVNAAIGKLMVKVLPVMTTLFSITLPSALTLYIITTTAMGYYQQKRVLDQDKKEMDEEVVESKEKPQKTTKKKTATKKKTSKKQARKK
jgi:YidC/Oxa1 family membrane protein insertase